ncbi:MAG: recombination mediator RecR [Nitrospinota bacterium]
MRRFPAIQACVEELAKLPGIGPKSAQRIVFHLLKAPAEQVEALARSLGELRQRVRFCRQCHGLAEGELCNFCADPGRDAGLVCVVEEPADVFAVERAGDFHGLYHVLMGTLAPMQGVGPEKLTVDSLLARLKEKPPREVIVATNPSMEGEATALYLAKVIKPLGIRVSRIARGLPVGGALEYADELTLSRSLEGRREL